jgi:multiple sugar transport system ATP-binding protein
VDGLDAPDGPVTLGFRAEDIKVVKTGGDAKATVYSMELLGDATQISIRADGAILSGKAPKDFRAQIGDPIGFKIKPDVCHLFDAETGERL